MKKRKKKKSPVRFKRGAALDIPTVLVTTASHEVTASKSNEQETNQSEININQISKSETNRDGPSRCSMFRPVSPKPHVDYSAYRRPSPRPHSQLDCFERSPSSYNGKSVSASDVTDIDASGCVLDKDSFSRRLLSRELEERLQIFRETNTKVTMQRLAKARKMTFPEDERLHTPLTERERWVAQQNEKYYLKKWIELGLEESGHWDSTEEKPGKRLWWDDIYITPDMLYAALKYLDTPTPGIQSERKPTFPDENDLIPITQKSVKADKKDNKNKAKILGNISSVARKIRGGMKKPKADDTFVENVLRLLQQERKKPKHTLEIRRQPTVNLDAIYMFQRAEGAMAGIRGRGDRRPPMKKTKELQYSDLSRYERYSYLPSKYERPRTADHDQKPKPSPGPYMTSLNQLYLDKKYFDYLLRTETLATTGAIMTRHLARAANDYLRERVKFWAEQQGLPAAPLRQCLCMITMNPKHVCKCRIRGSDVTAWPEPEPVRGEPERKSTP